MMIITFKVAFLNNMINSKLLDISCLMSFIITVYLERMVQCSEFFSTSSVHCGHRINLVNFPIAYLGRKAVDLKATIECVVCITNFVLICLNDFLRYIDHRNPIKLFQISCGITIPSPVKIGTVILYLITRVRH